MIHSKLLEKNLINILIYEEIEQCDHYFDTSGQKFLLDYVCICALKIEKMGQHLIQKFSLRFLKYDLVYYSTFNSMVCKNKSLETRKENTKKK